MSTSTADETATYTLNLIAPGEIEVLKWADWEPFPVARYVITDGKCSCPHALYRKATCKHMKLAKEQGLLTQLKGKSK